MDWKNWETWQGWAIDGFKALVGIMILWVGKWARKAAIPYVKNIKAIFKVSVRLQEIEKQAANDRVEIVSLKGKLSLCRNTQLAFLRTTTIPYFMTDNKGDLTFINDACLKMMGFNDSEDALDGGYLQSVPKIERQQRREEREDFYKHPSPYQGEVNFENIQTHDLIKTACRCDLITDENDKFVGMLVRLEIISTIPKQQ